MNSKQRRAHEHRERMKLKEHFKPMLKNPATPHVVKLDILATLGMAPKDELEAHQVAAVEKTAHSEFAQKVFERDNLPPAANIPVP